VALAIVVAALLHVALPAKYRVDPAWVVPAVLLALLAALIIGDPGRIDRQKTWLRIVTGAVIAFLTVANLLAAIHLFHDILTYNKLFADNATGLLATGGVIWATNVIAFGLWYWDLDRGGAAARAPSAGEPGVHLPGDAAHPVRAGSLGAEVRRLPVAGLLDRHRVQPRRRLRGQAVGQAADDHRSGRVSRHRRAGDRPRDQHPGLAADYRRLACLASSCPAVPATSPPGGSGGTAGRRHVRAGGLSASLSVTVSGRSWTA
jgi:hypothetical protein